MLVHSSIYQKENEHVETVSIGGGKMAMDAIGRKVNTCVDKGGKCIYVIDTYGHYCQECGFVVLKL